MRISLPIDNATSVLEACAKFQLIYINCIFK